jgi:hypothetical protein
MAPAALRLPVSGGPNVTPLAPSEAPAPKRAGDRDRTLKNGSTPPDVATPSPAQPPSRPEANVPLDARSNAERSDPRATQPPTASKGPAPRAPRPRPQPPRRLDQNLDPFAERL